MPKVGRPKHLRPHEIKLAVAKDPLKYKAKRLYWALLSLEKKMARDITSVRMSEYNTILNAYVECSSELNKTGRGYGSTVKQGMDAKGTGQGSTEQGGASGTSENGSSDMGVGVSTVNPIT